MRCRRDRPSRLFERWVVIVKRVLRLIASGVLAISRVSVFAGPAAGASRPTKIDRLIWNVACVHIARGTVSPQVALVCTHSGFPMWEAKRLAVLETICERALRGDYVYRSQYPTELAACFFA